MDKYELVFYGICCIVAAYGLIAPDICTQAIGATGNCSSTAPFYIAAAIGMIAFKALIMGKEEK